MKEATGELNMTVVIVVAVAFLSVFFFAILWPSIKNTYIATNKCSDAICEKPVGNNSTVKCTYYDKNKKPTEIECVWKG